MAEEQNTQSQIDDGQIQTEPAIETAVNEATVSPTDSKDADRLAALEAQLARLNERNQLLEKSLQLNERFFQNQNAQKPAPATEKDNWTQEMEVLDKALDPLLQKRFKSVTEPLNQHYNTIVEDNDALRFEMFLSRNNPEILDDEDAYSKTMQQVQSIRDAARQRGMSVSRIDAFVFNEGLNNTRQRTVDRKKRKTQAINSEVRRVAETQVAQATSVQSEPRATGNAGINVIRDKANRGERLTPDERAKLRDFVSGVEV